MTRRRRLRISRRGFLPSSGWGYRIVYARRHWRNHGYMPLTGPVYSRVDGKLVPVHVLIDEAIGRDR